MAAIGALQAVEAILDGKAGSVVTTTGAFA